MLINPVIKERLKLLLQRLTPKSLWDDLKALVKNITMQDILLLSILPLLLFLLMLLPESIRTLLQFHVKAPLWWQFFTACYLHNDWQHLTSNLIGYFLIVTPTFIYAANTNLKLLYFKIYLAVCLTLPFLSGIIDLWQLPKHFPNMQTTSGASGIISAFAGIMLFIWIRHISLKSNKDIDNQKFFYISIFYVAILYVVIYSPSSLGIISLLLAIFTISAILYRNELVTLWVTLQEETKTNMLFLFLSLFLPMLFMVIPILLFPTLAKVFDNGKFVDFFMHYTGLIYGMIVSWIFILIDKGVFRKSIKKEEKRP